MFSAKDRIVCTQDMLSDIFRRKGLDIYADMEDRPWCRVRCKGADYKVSSTSWYMSLCEDNQLASRTV